jgi:adenine-specific DNA-methyltransferase
MTSTLVADASTQKSRGGYYTPPAISRFLAEWAVRSPGETVLEPSCGDGNLLEAAAARLLRLGATPEAAGEQVQGVELYPSEAARARARLAVLGVSAPNAVREGDFFAYCAETAGLFGRAFDVAIGNPPFLRYHAFPDEQRERAFAVMREAGLRPTKLTNSWASFLVAASLRLDPRGRLAMVIPAELLQVKYAEETRAFLARHFGAITIITFRRLVFEGIQQEVVLLLAEKKPSVEGGIDVIEFDDARDLEAYRVTLRERVHLKTVDHASEKWTQYYLAQEEIDLLRAARKHPALKRLGDFARVDVGVVTGENRFFVLRESEVRARGLEGLTLPLVGRTVQIPGLTLTPEEFARLREGDSACHLLNLPNVPFESLSDPAQQYVRVGEAADYHTGYKCRIRKPWYVVPSRWSPDAFLFRQINRYPKMVHNPAGAISTDTIHRVRFHQPEHGATATLSFMNALTFAFSEIMGRSYGGGVHELEPNEADNLPVPFFADWNADLTALDALERARQTDAILAVTDAELLQNRLGFTRAETETFRRIWRTLSDRRIGRRAKTARPEHPHARLPAPAGNIRRADRKRLRPPLQRVAAPRGLTPLPQARAGQSLSWLM